MEDDAEFRGDYPLVRTRSTNLVWSFCIVSIASAATARAELVAHWKFESDAPFEDAVSRLHLNPEGKEVGGKNVFRVTENRPPKAIESKGSLVSPSAQTNDLRLRVNAPTRGGNPFRLKENTWTFSGWFQHTGAKAGPFGHVIAGTHGYIPGRGFGGWSLRVVEEEGGAKKLAAVFSNGGETPVTFEVKSDAAIEAGADQWGHFALVWQHDGGNSRKGEAQLFVGAKAAGAMAAPAGFDVAMADRNAFRGIWIAGRSSSKEQNGSENWPGRLDELKFFNEAIVDEARLLVESGANKPEAKPKAAEVAAKTDPASPPKEPAPPPPPKKPEPPKEKVLAIRTWTDLRKETMEAAMVIPADPVAGRVLLQTKDGIRFSLSLERLSPEDRGYVSSSGGG